MTSTECVLDTIKAERGDSGPYRLTLTNPSGSHHIVVNVTVLDRPGPPEGPLKVTDVDADGCTLLWMPPIEDGGDRVLNKYANFNFMILIISKIQT